MTKVVIVENQWCQTTNKVLGTCQERPPMVSKPSDNKDDKDNHKNAYYFAPDFDKIFLESPLR